MTIAELTPKGLHVANPKHVVVWSDVLNLEWTATGALVATTQGVVAVDRVAAAIIEACLCPWERQRDAAVDALRSGERAAWLGGSDGTSPGGKSIGSRTKRWLRALVAGGCLGAGLGAIWSAAAGAPSLGGVSDAWACAVALAMVSLGFGIAWRHIGRMEFELTPNSVTLGPQARRLRWSDVRAVHVCAPSADGLAGAPASYLVFTTHGRFTFNGAVMTNVDAFVAALQRCLDFGQKVASGSPRGRWVPSRGVAGDGLWIDDQRALKITATGAAPLTWQDLHPESIKERYESLTAHYFRDDFVSDAALETELAQRMLADLGFTARPGEETTPTELEQLLDVASGGAVESGGARADASGVSVRAGAQTAVYGWSEIRSIEWGAMPIGAGIMNYCRVTTDKDWFNLSLFDPNVGEFAGAIARVLLARQAGMSLPSATPVPSAAISRMSVDETAAAERGLSVAGER